MEASANIMVKVESVRVIVPPWLGDCFSFYRPRWNQFTSVPHYFAYV
jgi:hypothetical protein